MISSSSSSSSPLLLTAAIPDAVTLDHLDASELQRAARHHRRAISALQGGSFMDLSEDVNYSLLKQLQRDLHTLEVELQRRSTTRNRAA